MSVFRPGSRLWLLHLLDAAAHAVWRREPMPRPAQWVCDKFEDHVWR